VDHGADDADGVKGIPARAGQGLHRLSISARTGAGLGARGGLRFAGDCASGRQFQGNLIP
jgi:hypothetical protein